MKVVLLGLLLLTGCMKDSAEVTTASSPATEVEAASKVPVSEEDCDDKAKKPIEIKEETISLSGNTGCTLEE